MSYSRYPFLFFLQDTPSGMFYYKDASGNTQKTNIHSANTIPIALKHAPKNWMDQELSFERNKDYYGINRAYGTPMQLVKDAAAIARELYYGGKGIETLLTLSIYKYNDQPLPGEPQYKLYHKSPVNFTGSEDDIITGITVGLFQGGIIQLIKTYESTIIELPCDGSIPENAKVLLDGMLVKDTAYFTITPISTVNHNVLFSPFLGIADIHYAGTVPASLVDEDGDSFDVVLASPSYEAGSMAPTPADFFTDSNSYIFSSVSPIDVRIKGSITLRTFNANKVSNIVMYAATNNTVQGLIGGVEKLTRTWDLFNGNFEPGINSFVFKTINSQTVLDFDITVSLQANENLFVVICTREINHDKPCYIVGGNIELSFNSAPPAVSVWCISLYDAINLLLKYICQLASTTDYPIAFEFISSLLEKHKNLMLTSGDALRAAGDPTYQKFYNAIQTNINFPNLNLIVSYGPTAKICLKDAFNNVSCILMAAMGNQQFPDTSEQLFIEALDYVFNSTSDTMALGEVAGMKVVPADDLMFTRARFGWKSSLSDQKAGKYSWMGTLEMQAPVKSIPDKIFEKVSPWEADPYIIQRLIANINDTSTTRNANDSSVYNLSADLNNSGFDFWKAHFISGSQDVTLDSNQNIQQIVNIPQQPVNMPSTTGGYFLQGNEPAIFVLSDETLAAVTMPLQLVFQGNLSSPAALPGTPPDTCTIKLFYNGTVIYTQTFTVTGASTPIDTSTAVFPQAFSYKDCLYVTISTSNGGQLDDFGCTMLCGVGGSYFSASGSPVSQILAGTANKLVAMPIVTPSSTPYVNGTSVVQYGFQYFQFNAVVPNSNFDLQLWIKGLTNGRTTDEVYFDFFLNGDVQDSLPMNGSDTLTPFGPIIFLENITFQLGDVMFLTATNVSPSLSLQSYITECFLLATSTAIIAFRLYREQYDVISGIPNLLGNVPGTNKPLTTGPGAPFNIVPYSPKRMFLAWKRYMDSCLYYQRGGYYTFNTVSKNKYLSTTLNGVTITESAAEPIGTDILFLPHYLTFKTMVQRTFADLMTGAVNAHVHNTYFGNDFYGFPGLLKQKPGTMEAQEWKLLASPKTPIKNFYQIDTSGFKLLDMPDNSIVWAKAGPVQFVSQGTTPDPQINTRNRYEYWFSEQVDQWVNQNTYQQYFQNNDTVALQFITKGLSTVVANIYLCDKTLIAGNINIPNITSAGVASPYMLFQGAIDISTLSAGTYFIEIVAWASGATSKLISEPIRVATSWPGTVLLKYSCSYNTQNLFFTDTNYQPQIRVDAILGNMFKRTFKNFSYVDQVQDITPLQGYPYDTCDFWLGMADGVPFWLHQKVSDALLMDGASIENEGLTYDDSSDWEETFIPGNPKRFYKTRLRAMKNMFANIATAAGASDDSSMLITIDAISSGPNANNNTNSSESDIVGVLID